MSQPRACTLIAASLLAAAPGRAESPAKRDVGQALSTAPDACFDGSSLAESVASWLQTRQIDARVAILVRRPTESTVRFTVERSGTLVGERDLPVGALPCPDLRAAVSLAIAIAIDHTLLESLGIEPPASEPTIRDPGAGEPAPIPSPKPAARPTPAPAPPPPPAPPRTQPERGATRGHLGIDALGLFGVLPGPALGVAPTVGVSPIRWLDLRAGALGTTRAQTSVGGGTVSASLLAGRLEICALGSDEEEVRIAGCLGAAAGSLSSEGSGLEPSYSPGLRWAAATLRAEARYPAAARLGLLASISGWLPILRPELRVVDRDGRVADAWTAPLAGFGVGLGGDLLLW